MQPNAGYYCYLTYLQGDFSGTSADGPNQGAQVQVENDNYWHLVSYRATDYAAAKCVEQACFVGQGSYSVEWNDINYNNITNPYIQNSIVVVDTNGISCSTNTNTSGWPQLAGTESSITMLAGWPIGYGATAGPNSFGPATSTSTTLVSGGPNTLFANTCVLNEEGWGSLTGTYLSIFVGELGTTVPVTPISTQTLSGNADVDMGVSGDDGICYMTGVSGGFGSGSSVALFLGNNPTGGEGYEWYGQTTLGGGSDLTANVACMAYNVPH